MRSTAFSSSRLGLTVLGPKRHRLLRRDVVLTGERAPSQLTLNDAAVVDHEAGIPAGRADLVPDAPHPLVRYAGRDVDAGVRPDTGAAVVVALEPQPEGRPVGLACRVVIDLRETESFKPAAGCG